MWESVESTIRKRFELTQSQFFAFPKHKNLHWSLNGKFFGFGDIREVDIRNIQMKLDEREVFEGWNEHHFSELTRQTEKPIIRITHNEVTWPHFESFRKK